MRLKVLVLEGLMKGGSGGGREGGREGEREGGPFLSSLSFIPLPQAWSTLPQRAGARSL